MRLLLAAPLVLTLLAPALAEEPFIPRRQSKPPGPPKSPQEAIAAMEVPEGFSVELVAAEPDLVNPVAMTIDEKGRYWICESLEYPRREPGPGRDRVKVLEDTDGDGAVDKTTVYADGLNIPSGIAVGHGGVWVANAPDILFLQDTDGDGKADKREVVVTGFGRDDTHELPNSLTWGPDGWLYGLNGVFNPCVVEQDGRRYEFTCAVFRIHPVTRRFELFCEGTSNPWGIAFDPEGSMFISACVIDHFWHLTETGYYLRQGGPYLPHTWVLGSIVKHTHQMAAYCGLHYCDSDAFPPEWRNVFLMGNIHGGCLNADVVERSGSTYVGKPRRDFLTANDVWFMPIEQMTGPDGSLYVLDWYDRYHCYQDANHDPAGIDRLHGRLYRVRYKDTPHLPKGFDLAKETDDQLVERLDAGNDFLRATARRLLTERLLAKSDGQSLPGRREKKELADGLWDIVQTSESKTARMNALWTLLGGQSLEGFMLTALLDSKDDSLRAWGVRAAGQMAAHYSASIERGEFANRTQPPQFRGTEDVPTRITALASDPSADVRLQAAIAISKINVAWEDRSPEGRPNHRFRPNFLWPGGKDAPDAIQTLVTVLKNAGDDALTPGIVWQNLEPYLEHEVDHVVATAESLGPDRPTAVDAVLVRIADWILAEQPDRTSTIVKLVTMLAKADDPTAARQVLRSVQRRLVSGEIAEGDRLELSRSLSEVVAPAIKDENRPLHRDAVLLATAWGDNAAALVAAKLLGDRNAGADDRLAAAEALVSGGDEQTVHKIAHLAADANTGPAKLRGVLLAALGRSGSDTVAHAVLQNFDDLEPQLKPRAIELLAQRPAWGAKLVAAVEAGKVSKDAVNVNQVRALVGSTDQALAKRATAIWGSVREGRSPEREQVIAEVRERLEKTPADPAAGQAVFTKVCGQCHKIYGQGEEVGPDITRNGRNDYAQLLSNVLDPSLVIGAGYQAHTVVTTDGRVLAGLVVEDTPQRLVLKLQGGKTEAIPRDEVEEDSVSPVSLMPEGLERQLTPRELADLFAFLSLDRPPSDPEAQRLSGAPEGK